MLALFSNKLFDIIMYFNVIKIGKKLKAFRFFIITDPIPKLFHNLSTDFVDIFFTIEIPSFFPVIDERSSHHSPFSSPIPRHPQNYSACPKYLRYVKLKKIFGKKSFSQGASFPRQRNS
jgi:hypothetical protein